MALVKSGDQEAKNAAERADALHKQFTRLQRIVETRIQLALIYVSFLKLVQQVQSSVEIKFHPDFVFSTGNANRKYNMIWISFNNLHGKTLWEMTKFYLKYTYF